MDAAGRGTALCGGPPSNGHRPFASRSRRLHGACESPRCRAVPRPAAVLSRCEAHRQPTLLELPGAAELPQPHCALRLPQGPHRLATRHPSTTRWPATSRRAPIPLHVAGQPRATNPHRPLARRLVRARRRCALPATHASPSHHPLARQLPAHRSTSERRRPTTEPAKDAGQPRGACPLSTPQRHLGRPRASPRSATPTPATLDLRPEPLRTGPGLPPDCPNLPIVPSPSPPTAPRRAAQGTTPKPKCPTPNWGIRTVPRPRIELQSE